MTDPTRLPRSTAALQFQLDDLLALTATGAVIAALVRVGIQYPDVVIYLFGCCMLLGTLILPGILLLGLASVLQVFVPHHNWGSHLLLAAAWLILIGIAGCIVLPVPGTLMLLLFFGIRRVLRLLSGRTVDTLAQD
jgi:hypothetical protein